MELFMTPLGQMEIIEYYLYYDRPYIFHCRDKVSNNYIVHLVDDDEFCERWFLVPASRLRIEAVRTGRISLRDSVRRSESEWIWEITTPFDGSLGEATIKRCETLTESDLPDEVFLNLPDKRLPELETDAEREAEQLYRDVLYLYLNDGQHSQLISAEHLGAILLRSQGLLYSLVYRDGSSRGRIPSSIKDEATMYFTGDFAASVGIKLEAKHSSLVDSPLRDALNTLLDLLSAGANKDVLTSILTSLPERSIARYRFLLQALEQANVTFKAEWGSPGRGKRVAYLSIDDIKGAIQIMELEEEDMSQIIKLTGELVGLLTDKEKNRFTFEFVSNEGERYKGRLSDDLIKKIEAGLSLNIPAKNKTIELEETLEINPTTSEERISYTLISIN